MSTNNAKSMPSIESMAKNLNKYAQMLFVYFVMLCAKGAKGAAQVQADLKTLRAEGGLARKYATIIQNFLVTFAGYYPASGDEDAGFIAHRSAERCKEYASMNYADAWKSLNASNLKTYAKVKDEKPIDPKEQAVKTIGGWNTALVMFIRTHKSEITALMQATPKA